MWNPSRRPPRAAAQDASAARGRRVPALTLVELLAALAILTLVLSLAYGSFFQISGGAGALTDELSEQQELRLLLKMIADDLQSARYLNNFTAKQANNLVRQSGLVAKVRFVGKNEFSFVDFHGATEARFFRQRPPELDPGLHEIGYSVQEDTAKQTINLVRREDYYLDNDMLHDGVSVILTRRLETFSLAFLLPADSAGSTTERWDREWDSNNVPAGTPTMPRAIRIGLGLIGKDGHPLRETLEVNLPIVPKAGP